jgi:ankyrin repeat protein
MEAINGHTLLNEAVEMLRVTTMELLLRRGADINKKLKNTGNTISHELLKLYQNSKETVLAALVLFARYKANFYETNNEGVSVLDRARVEGIDL